MRSVQNSSHKPNSLFFNDLLRNFTTTDIVPFILYCLIISKGQNNYISYYNFLNNQTIQKQTHRLLRDFYRASFEIQKLSAFCLFFFFLCFVCQVHYEQHSGASLCFFSFNFFRQKTVCSFLGFIFFAVKT